MWFYLRNVFLQAFGITLLKTAYCLHFCFRGLKSVSLEVKRDAGIERNSFFSVWQSTISKLEIAFVLCSRQCLMTLVHRELAIAGLHETEDFISGYNLRLLPSF